MDRSGLPAYLVSGAGGLTTLAGAAGILTALSWTAPSGSDDGLAAGLAAAAIVFVIVLSLVVVLLGVVLALFGTVAVRREWTRAPTVVLGGYVGLVVAAVAYSASTSAWFGGTIPVLGYGSLLIPVAGLLGGWLASRDLAAAEASE